VAELRHTTPVASVLALARRVVEVQRIADVRAGFVERQVALKRRRLVREPGVDEQDQLARELVGRRAVGLASAGITITIAVTVTVAGLVGIAGLAGLVIAGLRRGWQREVDARSGQQADRQANESRFHFSWILGASAAPRQDRGIAVSAR